ncbi:hypothetical protein ACH5A2_12205 [Streptomyces collinus]|uniref:hypothetical protein n=1 Tax=Streptomyces collinus TaxID=42684 RepID=UPI0037A8DD88
MNAKAYDVTGIDTRIRYDSSRTPPFTVMTSMPYKPSQLAEKGPHHRSADQTSWDAAVRHLYRDAFAYIATGPRLHQDWTLDVLALMARAARRAVRGDGQAWDETYRVGDRGAGAWGECGAARLSPPPCPRARLGAG